MQTKTTIGILIIIAIVLAAVVAWLAFSGEDAPNPVEITGTQEINSFEDCVEAGFTVIDAHTRECRTDDGRTFVEGAVVEKREPKVIGDPAIRVQSPNGGESLSRGQSYNIVWDGLLATDSPFHIKLWNGETPVETIVFNYFGTSPYMWDISSSTPAGSNYRIEVIGANSEQSDFSDAPFAIK